MVTCHKCRRDVAPQDIERYLGRLWCVQCYARDLGVTPRPYTDPNAPDPQEATRRLQRETEAVILTTAPAIEGYRVVETREIVSAECVFGLNIFADLFASMSDIFGGRSRTTQNKLREARQTCLAELRNEAVLAGANAVIAVSLDYSEFSGQGKSMLFLVASGTAVIIEPEVPAATSTGNSTDTFPPP